MDQQHQHSQIYRTRIWILMGYLGYSDVQQKAKQLWSEIIHSWCEIIQWYSPQPCSIIRVMLSHQETQHSEPRTLVLNRQRKQEEVRRVKGTQFYDWRKVLRLIFFFSSKKYREIFFCTPWRALYSSYLATRRTGNNMDHLSSRLRKLLSIINLTRLLQLSINHRKMDLEKQNITLSFQKRFQQRAKKASSF